MQTITANSTLDWNKQKIALISSRFNQRFVDPLVDGATTALLTGGCKKDNLIHMRVPGAYEIPWAAQEILKTMPDITGIVTLGVIIRGDTPHFDYVAGTCANGVAKVMLDTGIPVVFGVLTTDNVSQTIARTSTENNKGTDVTLALIEMLSLKSQLNK